MNRSTRWMAAFCLLVAGGAGGARAQTAAAPEGDYVSRQDYEQLKAELDAVKQQLGELKQQLAAPASPTPNAQTEQYLEYLDQELGKVKDIADANRIGTTKFVITGDADVTFVLPQHGNSTFEAGFGPMLLWEVQERLFLEAGLDFGLTTEDDGEGATEVELETANISYLINDNLMAGAGLFMTPFAAFHPHFDASWINKLPDEPLPFGDDGIAPGSSLGAFISGGVPVSTTMVNYAAYVSNGPSLNTDDADTAGTLNFDNFDDFNHNKAVGGRLGFLPVPELEVGYSVLFGEASPSGFGEEADALLQAVDASYKKVINPLAGTIDTHVEWVWSHVDRVTYDPTGALGFGPVSFANDRNGGYAQIAYRPTLVSSKVLRDLEFVFRYDILEQPRAAPGGFDEQRFTLGIDYWLAPSAVIKVAYEFTETRGAEENDMLLLQTALGF